MIDKYNKNISIPHKRSVYTIWKGVILIAAFCCLFIIGSFFDFNISKALFAHNKTINGKIGSFITDTLLHISWELWSAMFVACAMSSFVYKKNKLWLTIIVNLVCWIYVVVDFGRTLASINSWVDELGQIGSIVYNTLLTIFTTAASVCFGIFGFKKLDQKVVFKVTFWFVLTCVVIGNLRQFLAIIASRPRPRIIFATDDPQKAFVPWWSFNPFRCYDKSIKNSFMYMSFPSGHSAEVFFLIGFGCCLYRIGFIKTWKNANIVFGTCILFAILAPIGRMIGGWHFMSDVSAGSLFSIIGFFCLNFFFNWRTKFENKIV